MVDARMMALHTAIRAVITFFVTCSLNLHTRSKFVIRQFKKPRQQRQGQRRLKSELILNVRISRCSLNMERSVIFGIEIIKISRRHLRPPDNVELGHFTLPFAENGKCTRN